MGVTCQILLHRPPQGFYVPGLPVTGILKYAVAENTKFNKIEINLKGKGYCEWREDVAFSSDTTSTTTYTNKEVICNIRKYICHEKPGTASFSVRKGVYEDAFEFILPPHCPPSFKSKNAYIKYVIKVKFDTAGIFTFAKKFFIEISVRNYGFAKLPEPPVIFGLNKILAPLFSSSSGVIRLRGQIPKLVLTSGEIVYLNFSVRNESNVNVSTVQAKIISVKKLMSRCGRSMIEEKTVSESSSPSISGNNNVVFTMGLPVHPEEYTIRNSKVVSKEYILKVTLKMAGLHKNEMVEVPVILEAPSREDLIRNTMKDAHCSRVPPPSYWDNMTGSVSK